MNRETLPESTMAIQRWDPLRDLREIRERMNRLFDDAAARDPRASRAETVTSTGWKPPVDVFENDDRYILRADLPGLTSSDVDIEVEDGTLVLRGERKPDPGVPSESYLRTERPHGRFSLQLALPPSIDRHGIRASHAAGVLEIVLPKRKEDAPSRVKVQVQ
jgi:HSP20 family protein